MHRVLLQKNIFTLIFYWDINKKQPGPFDPGCCIVNIVNAD